MKIIVPLKAGYIILAPLVVAACADSSAPSAPNFVVVSTDWRTTLVDPGTQSTECPSGVCRGIGGRAATYQYTAHGVFRNQGASGSAVVTFSAVEMRTFVGSNNRLVTSPQTFSCNTVVKAEAGQVTEASCPMEGVSTTDSPPTAKVSQ